MDDRFFMQYLKDSPVSRERLSYVFNRLCDEGTLGHLFSDGTVRTREEFVADILRVGSLPFLVFWEGKYAGLTWYNTLEGRSARGHYVFFKSVWGRRTSAVIGRCIYEHVLSLRDEHGYLFDVILGLVAKRNALAWKLPLLCGAFPVGDIPHGAYMAEKDRSEDAVLVAVTRESLGMEER